MPVILATWEVEIRKITVPSQPQNIVPETLPRKYPRPKKGHRVTQLIEHLPRKHETPSSNPSATKKKKKKLSYNPVFPLLGI
jgi:hypothetical protein